MRTIIFLMGLAWGVASAQEVPHPAPSAQVMGLSELLQLTLENHPRLKEAAFGIDEAQGKAVQAGLYPNPVLRVQGDELGDRQGSGGIWTAPSISQEIVTADKLQLQQAAALRQVDQAMLRLRSERAARLTAVRKKYYDVLTLHRRQQILSELVNVAKESVETTRKLLEAKRAAELDLLRGELALDKARAELEATQQEIPGALRRLAASVGVVDLPCTFISGSLEMQPPEYDLKEAVRILLATHPDIMTRHAEVAQAELLLRRAEAEVIPNVTVETGYMYQGQNRSNDWMIGLSLPLPVWDRNEGNIQAAQARVGGAVQTVGRTQADLVEQLAEAFRTYASAKKRAELYRTSILPRSRETYNLTLNAYRAGQFSYLRVLEAQNATVEVNLEYNRSLGEVWQAASEIAGLLQLE